MTKLTMGIMYLVTSPLANTVIKAKSSSGLSPPAIHFKIENMQLTIINFLSAYIASALLCHSIN